jgi:hypothetical protein
VVRQRTLIVSALLLLALLAGIVALGVRWFRSAEDKLWRDRLPGGLESASIEYRKTADYGGGPGGNSAGIVIYRLSQESAERFLKDGIGRGRDDRHPRRWTYRNWRPTPVLFDERWTRHGDNGCSGREPGIGAYIDYGRFRCTVDPSVIARANQIAMRPGAYYAYGSASSVIIVAPTEGLVVLAFNG